MSKKIAYEAALANWIENNEKLNFAHRSLSGELFERIYKSYRRAFWAQLALPIAYAILLILEWIFLPAEPSADFKSVIIMLQVALFVVPVLPIWLVVCDFTFGKDWRKYCKWYKRRSHPNELYAIFNDDKSKK